jgi:hypothetical protein
MVFLPLSLCSDPNRQELSQPRPVPPAGSAQPINQTQLKPVLRIRIRDPVFFDPGNQDPDPGAGMNSPENFPKSLETVFWVKIFKFFYTDPDPRSGSKSRIRDPDPISRVRDLLDPEPGIWDGKIRIRDPVQTSRICNTG